MRPVSNSKPVGITTTLWWKGGAGSGQSAGGGGTAGWLGPAGSRTVHSRRRPDCLPLAPSATLIIRLPISCSNYPERRQVFLQATGFIKNTKHFQEKKYKQKEEKSLPVTCAKNYKFHGNHHFPDGLSFAKFKKSVACTAQRVLKDYRENSYI